MTDHHQDSLPSPWMAAQRCAWLAAILLATTSAQAVENNDYKLQTPIQQNGNGINVDPASGNVLISYNHGMTVWPKGPGGQSQLLNFGTGGNPSPSGAVLSGGTYYLGYYWYYGEVHKFSNTGQDQGTDFVLGSGNKNNNGIQGMVGDSAGHLAIAARNMSKDGGEGVVVTDMAGNVQWSKSVPGIFQTAVDAQNNVYVGGSGSNLVQVYDPSGNPLRTIGPIASGTVGGVAVDQRGNVYIANWGWASSASFSAIEKYNAAGIKVATITGYGAATANSYSTPLAVDPSGKYLYAIANSNTQVLAETTSAPTAPALSATGSNSPTSIQANWPAPSSPMTSYSLQFSTDQTNWQTITVPGGNTSRTLTPTDVPGLAPGKTYYLQISATDPDGTSPNSKVVAVTIPALSPAPVPALGEWALATLALMLAALGWRRMRG